MELQTWIYYLIAISILTASPGPCVLLCVTKSVTSGFNYAIYTALGSLIATIGIMTLSFTGLGIVISSSEIIFTTIKYIGAAYLIYLGYKALTSKQENYELEKENKECKITKKDRFSSAFSGFLVGASNPKAIVFFVALFPQFIDTQSSLLTQYLIFVSTFTVLEISWLLFYSYLGHKSSSWFVQSGRAKFFNRITGGVFVTAGVLLSTSNRN